MSEENNDTKIDILGDFSKLIEEKFCRDEWFTTVEINDVDMRVEKDAVRTIIVHAVKEARKVLRNAHGVAIINNHWCISKDDVVKAIQLEEALIIQEIKKEPEVEEDSD